MDPADEVREGNDGDGQDLGGTNLSEGDPHRNRPSSGQSTAGICSILIRGSWSRGKNGRVLCNLNDAGKFPSTLELKLFPGRDAEKLVNGLFRQVNGAHELPLLDILKDTTCCKVHTIIGKGSMRKLAKQIEGAENPVPVLRHLQVTKCISGQRENGSILTSMKAGKFKQLETLEWDRSCLGDPEIQILVGVIQQGNFPSLSTLSLRRNQFSSRGATALVSSLGSLRNLKCLNLSGNDLGAGHLALAQAMKSHQVPALKKLHLEHTEIRDETCEEYEKGLISGSLQALKILRLGGNKIGLRGAKALGRAFKSRSVNKLVWIGLGNNLLNDDSLIELTKSLVCLPNLQELQFLKNQFTEVGIKFLSTALASGHLNSLKLLDLRFSVNPTENGARALLAAQCSSQVLETVEFEWSKFPALEQQRQRMISLGDRQGEQSFDRSAKMGFLESVQRIKDVLREGVMQAVEMGILCPEVSREVEHESSEGSRALVPRDFVASTSASPNYWEIIVSKLDQIYGLVEMCLKEIREGRSDSMKAQRTLLQLFLEDRERSCPRFIYLATKHGKWIKLKDAISASVTVRVHFACEARYNDYGQQGLDVHEVKNQRGLDVSKLKDWAQTVAPLLKLCLTIVYLSAKVAANFVAPGAGLLFPDFCQWQQASCLADGIALATGFSTAELSTQSGEWNQQFQNGTQSNPRELYGYSRQAMTDFLGKLPRGEYQKKLGLRKVSLSHRDESFQGCFWVCTDCYEKYRTSSIWGVTDL